YLTEFAYQTNPPDRYLGGRAEHAGRVADPRGPARVGRSARGQPELVRLARRAARAQRLGLAVGALLRRRAAQARVRGLRAPACGDDDARVGAGAPGDDAPRRRRGAARERRLPRDRVAADRRARRLRAGRPGAVVGVLRA